MNYPLLMLQIVLISCRTRPGEGWGRLLASMHICHGCESRGDWQTEHKEKKQTFTISYGLTSLLTSDA
jgi:hypothetical protein